MAYTQIHPPYVPLPFPISFPRFRYRPIIVHHLTFNPGDFILVSLLVALLCYTLTNRLLLAPTSHAAALLDNRVEFAYAFDVAVNAFFPAFLVLGVGLLPLASVVVGGNWVSLVFGK